MKFLAGVVVTVLLVWEPEWYELGVLMILAGMFWRPLDRMTRGLHMDLAGWRLERALTRSLHVDGDCRVAHRLLVGEKEQPMEKIPKPTQAPVPLLEALRLEVADFSNIPANEQHLGHLQVAIQSIAKKLVIELEYIERRVDGLEKKL